MQAVDSYFMLQAIQAAETSLYITSPNPRVGCVIVIDGSCVASGATQVAGGPHAEVMALQQAREQGITQFSDATIYVSLEPCSHYGRTPPCVEALLAVKPKRVVIAMLDPNPEVAGRGVNALQAAGIEVTVGVELHAALALNIGFVSRMLLKRPWLWLKIAASLDGCTALADGSSKWITGTAARNDGQHFRARSCLILTGIGTVLADDPLLNVRAIPTVRQPIRAIVDSQCRLPLDAAIINGDPIWLFVTHVTAQKRALLAQKNVKVITIKSSPTGKVDLHAMMDWIGQQPVNEIHVEAGAELNGALIEAGLVDELVYYLAPKLLSAGRPIAQFRPLSHLEQAPFFEIMDHRIIGADIRMTMRQPQHYQHLISQLKALKI